MDQKKTQHYNYAYEAIPMLFHKQTREFTSYLERDGVKFLQFWWDHVGKMLPDDKLSSPEGIKYEETRHDKIAIVWLTLPPPANNEEVYFMALILKPEKRFMPIHISNTDIYVLVKGRHKDGTPATVLGQVTPGARFVHHGEGSAPELAAFQQLVLQKLKIKA